MQRPLKKKAHDVFAFVEGYESASEQKYRIGIVRSHLYYIENLTGRVVVCINPMAGKYDGAISLLCTIPDHGPAITLSLKLAWIWHSLAPLNACGAGPVSLLAIMNASKKKSARISLAGVNLKFSAFRGGVFVPPGASLIRETFTRSLLYCLKGILYKAV